MPPATNCTVCMLHHTSLHGPLMCHMNSSLLSMLPQWSLRCVIWALHHCTAWAICHLDLLFQEGALDCDALRGPPPLSPVVQQETPTIPHQRVQHVGSPDPSEPSSHEFLQSHRLCHSTGSKRWRTEGEARISSSTSSSSKNQKGEQHPAQQLESYSSTLWGCM